MRVINFVAGFLVGAAMAVIVVLLTAPQSGGDLQTRLRARFDEILAEYTKLKDEQNAALDAYTRNTKQNPILA